MARIFVNIYHGGEVIRTQIKDGYNLSVARTFYVTRNTSLDELRRQIHAHLELLPTEYKLTIKARLNTAPPGTPYFYSLFPVECLEIWEMVIENATPMVKFSVIELIIDSKRITSETNYYPYPGSIAGSSSTPPFQVHPILTIVQI